MKDEEIIRVQLGREPRGLIKVATRCPLGMPETIITCPVVPARPGLDVPFEPFPTVFWLTCPGAIKAVSRLEDDGWIAKLEADLREDPEFRKRYEEAGESYAEFRRKLLTDDQLNWIKTQHPSWCDVICKSWVAGVPKGSGRLKCLHAHYADYLVRAVNPVGERVRGVRGTGLLAH
ncbi:MAG: DUF501 domain-containing protein [Firmicutes bacterium]|jgi:hypothetical protein|nr:DUF501 domain-containing protein [Bacillota bacterium]